MFFVANCALAHATETNFLGQSSVGEPTDAGER
jgi:hypothetical protein